MMNFFKEAIPMNYIVELYKTQIGECNQYLATSNINELILDILNNSLFKYKGVRINFEYTELNTFHPNFNLYLSFIRDKDQSVELKIIAKDKDRILSSKFESYQNLINDIIDINKKLPKSLLSIDSIMTPAVRFYEEVGHHSKFLGSITKRNISVEEIFNSFIWEIKNNNIEEFQFVNTLTDSLVVEYLNSKGIVDINMHYLT